jgi:RNA polymerase sigma-70 factor (ECF subfamily)
VFENFDQLREPERVRPWVFHIAKNACLMKRRKSVFAPSRELSLDDFLPRMTTRAAMSSFRSPIGLDCRTISSCSRK